MICNKPKMGKVSAEESWNTRLTREFPQANLPAWAKAMIANGIPSFVVVASIVKKDREDSAGVAYA
jgi:hypothetical protein